ncbi:camp-dependent protein kinase 8, partial [Halteromyces radiatus]|uniref:camp-dependent protein kinase 8 n=1 Tax=Halteromyces radiatus TaxID=101107 RepID=UPI00222120A5
MNSQYDQKEMKKDTSSLPSPKQSDDQVAPNDQSSKMDYEEETLNFQPLTSNNYPVSPPHSPHISSKNDQMDEPSTHTNIMFIPEITDMNHSPPTTQFETTYSIQQPQQEQHQKQSEDRMKIKLSDFYLLRTLGTGSFGRVHLVQSKVNQLYYAMKVLNKEIVVKKKQIEHTNNERNVLMSVDYPFLIKLWGTFQDPGNLYMVMDYIPGGEVFNLLRRKQRFSEEWARFYAAEALLSIAYLHHHNIIYRDLKPENLLIDLQGHLKITDFGFAKYVPDLTYTMCGTPDYLAPEIIQSKGYGKAVDYWSLGVLIYEMLAGYPPFMDDNQFRLYEKIVRCEPKYPDHFSPAAKDLLSNLLTTDLTRRYGNLKRGYMDLVDHPWFASMDFIKVASRQLSPPYVPPFKGSGDTSNFDDYEETKVPYGLDQPDKYGRYFGDF